MRTVPTFGLLGLLALGAYLGSYFALVRRGWGDANCGVIGWHPEYRLNLGGEFSTAGAFYSYAHWIDQRLRPQVWAEEQDLVALLAAEIAVLPPASTAPNPKGCIAAERAG